MLRLLFDPKYREGWIKFRFNPFWYGILGMPKCGTNDKQTNINL